MRKVAVLLLSFYFLTFLYCADNAKTIAQIYNKKDQRSAFLIGVIKTSQSLVAGKYGLCFESQSAYSREKSIKVIEELFFYENGIYSIISIGPQVNITSSVLEGILVGMYPGFRLQFINNVATWTPKLIFDLSYNTIVYGSLMVGCSVRKDIIDNSGIDVMLKLGIAIDKN